MNMIASLGYGIGYFIHDGANPGVFEEYGDVVDIPEHAHPVKADVDATHMKSPNATKEYIQGLGEGGDAQVVLHWEPGSTMDDALHTLLASGDVRDHQFVWPGGTGAATRTFSGYIKDISPSTPIDNRQTVTVTIKVTGAVVRGTVA